MMVCRLHFVLHLCVSMYKANNGIGAIWRFAQIELWLTRYRIVCPRNAGATVAAGSCNITIVGKARAFI